MLGPIALATTLSALCPVDWPQGEPPDFAHDLSGAVEDVELVLDTVPQATLERAAGRAEVSAGALAGMSIYRGKYRRGRRTFVAVHFVNLPLGDPFAGGRLVLAINGRGRCSGAGLWGRPEFEQDPRSSWGLFLRSLALSGSPSQEFGEGVQGSEVPGLLEQLAGADDGAAHLAIGRLYSAMKDVDWTLRQYNRYARQGEIMPVAWLRPMVDRFAEIARDSGALVRWLGADGVEAFRAEAEKVSQMFLEAEEALAAGDLEAAEAAIQPRFDSGICMRCHDLPAADGDAKVRATLRSAYFATPLPKGVYVPGYDLPAMPAIDPDQSGRLARLYRACLQVVSSLD